VTSLLAWNQYGEIVATLDGVNDGARAIDLAEQEAAGVKLKTFWNVSGAVASGTWPEHLGAAAHDYRVEVSLGAPAQIVALVHRTTGERRDRAVIEQVVAERRAGLAPADLSDVVGGPGSPIQPAAEESAPR